MATSRLKKRQFGPGNGANMPSLWVFLIIVLAILFALVLCTSGIMHLVQRRQRIFLRRRIANGEVDLEFLGIKKMNVPQSLIDKMPRYTFRIQSEDDLKTPAEIAKSQNRHSTMFAQATCAICLDDFVDNETSVRELPCNHIFHPECIDPFLKDNSSLCPLCKKSVFPKGYCPVPVTNLMVRRERLGRRVREGRHPAVQGYLAQRMVAAHARAAQADQAGTTLTTADAATSTDPEPVPGPGEITQETIPEAGTELTPVTAQISPAPRVDLEPPPNAIATQGTTARRTWRRERLARQHAHEFDQSGAEARQADERRPWWRRMTGLA